METAKKFIFLFLFFSPVFLYSTSYNDSLQSFIAQSEQLLKQSYYEKHEKIPFCGTILLPSTIENFPGWNILYRGDDYEIEADNCSNCKPRKGFFQIYENAKTDELYLLIIEPEGIKRPKRNELKTLEVLPHYPYKFYKITRIRKIEPIEPELIVSAEEKKILQKTIETWDIQEIKQSKKGFEIPDKTLILYMDPTLIANLEACPWNCDDNFIRLPTIIFINSIDKKDFQEIIDKIACAAIDIRFMHAKFAKAKKMEQGKVLAIPYNAQPSKNNLMPKTSSFLYG